MFRERQLLADTVKKVVARCANATSEKLDLSDRPANRSGASVKGKVIHDTSLIPSPFERSLAAKALRCASGTSSVCLLIVIFESALTVMSP